MKNPFYSEGDLKKEAEAHVAFRLAVSNIVGAAPFLYRLGNGEGGYIYEYLAIELAKAGYVPFSMKKSTAKRKTLSASQRIKVWKRDGYACRFCGSDDDLSVDHIIPFSKGGPDAMENYQTLCRPCNSRKKDRV